MSTITTGQMFRFTVPGLPPRSLSPNGRVHWRTKAKAKREQVTDWWVSIVAAEADHPGFTTFTGPVRCQITTYRRRTGREHDGDNMLSCLKHGLDQLQACGIVANDRQLRYEPIRQAVDPENQGYVLVELTEIEEAS